MTHTDTTQKTSVGAWKWLASMKPAEQQWPGTPAEWDAERERRARSIIEASVTLTEDYAVRYATATMPPRPVEPPFTCGECGLTDNSVFNVGGTHTRYAHASAAICREQLKRELRALRDGPTARYEVCGYEHWRGNKYVQTFHVSDTMTAESCKQSVQFEIIQSGGGGTAHAIYKRVGGA